jgi:hypothetical protein
VIDSSDQMVNKLRDTMDYDCGLLLFAQNRGKSTDLRTQGSANVLRAVGYQIFNSGHDVVKESCSV